MIDLETPRLSLRPLTASDFASVHRLHTDPFVVHALFGGTTPSRKDTYRRMQYYLRDWRCHGFGFFSVFLKSDISSQDEFIGRAGLRYFEATTNVEYGHCFFGHAAGEGLGPEAGKAVLRFAFQRLELDRIVAVVRPENGRGIRAVEKIGFRYVEDRVYGDCTKGFYEIHASSF
ncbi:GNAT family N-acetyltransferase [Chelativorans alearense]|uniref:GNAT family N-acetyltransferase n=1 Tax=Chelativorans alearense TaxID=2681495 RepID=UPI0013D5231C|nr:GNAT family N-acetyltransferase [Chelativorans alearense]